MTRISDNDFAQIIINALTEMQERLIERRASGRCEDQSIIPTVNITDKEMRKLSGRTRIKSAFITNLTWLLEDGGLEVDYDHDTGTMSVTKPAEDIDVDFDSLRDLQAMLENLKDK